jgi:hypothetical protein
MQYTAIFMTANMVTTIVNADTTARVHFQAFECILSFHTAIANDSFEKHNVSDHEKPEDCLKAWIVGRFAGLTYAICSVDPNITPVVSIEN